MLQTDDRQIGRGENSRTVLRREGRSLKSAEKSGQGDSRSLFEHVRVRSRPHKPDHSTLNTIDQQQIAADVTFAMITPVALQWMIQPFRPERRIIGDQQSIAALSCAMSNRPFLVSRSQSFRNAFVTSQAGG